MPDSDGLFGFRRQAAARWRAWLAEHSPYTLFQQELAYWDRRLGGRWRLDEGFALLTLANLCLLPVALLIFPGLFLLYALLDEVLGMLITLPAALMVVRERESQTWGILRTTPISGLQIATGKLSGLLYLVWEGVSYMVQARWIGTLQAAPIFALMLSLSNPFPLAAGQPVWLTAGVLLLAYGLFIYRPYLNLLYGGCLGLAFSTTARTTSEAISLTMLVTSATLIMAGGWLAASVYAGQLPLIFSESVLAGRLEQVFVWLLPLAALTLLRVLLIPACLAFAAYRLHRLSD